MGLCIHSRRLSQGAAYASGHGLGRATTLGVLCHEIPHEIGDLAILVQNGFSKQQAILAQLCTAVGAVVGTLLGLLSKSSPGLEQALLGITSGGFVYIAAVTVLPELLTPSGGTTLWAQTLAESCSFSAGVAMMLLVTTMEK
jgi:zinc transporter 7